jgi:dTMP kinase
VGELFLLEAARSQVVTEVVAPALAAGAYVLSDRFADSSVAYQAGARGIDRAVVERLNALACAGIVPDRTLVFDIDVAIALSRARSRLSTNADNRRFEDEALHFHQAVAAAYRELAAREPSRVVLVDGSGTEDEVGARTLAAVADLLP